MENKADSILMRLARETSVLRTEDLPAEVVERLVTAVIDALEACFDGAAIEDGPKQVLAALAQETEGVTVFGAAGKASVEDAVFCNIVAGSFSARNDIHTEGRVHPGLTLIPSVLAEAEQRHLSGREVIAALAGGYETMIRMGLALQAGSTYPLSGSLRASMLAAPLGNAFALSRLRGLDAERTANAAALALNHLCGVNQWRIESTGEDAYQNAWDALNARSSVRLAEAGIRGAMGNLDGQYGFLSLFGAEREAHRLTDEFGSRFELLQTKSKPAGACIRLLAPCQLAQDLLEDPSFDLSQLERITVKVTSRVAKNAWFSNKNIIGQSSAINSVPYGISAVLAGGGLHTVSWCPPFVEKSFAWMDRIELVCDEYSKAVLEPQGCRLIAHMRDGSTIEKERLIFSSLTPEQVDQRFRYTIGQRFGTERGREILKTARSLERLEDVSVLCRMLRLS